MAVSEYVARVRALVAYALEEINVERSIRGVQNVTLSSITCGQAHADQLLEYGYFSHWSIDGLKPYMRYTLAGGRGVVNENMAWVSSTWIFDPYDAIEILTHDLVYDDEFFNWSHRNNLLDPKHNRVSIGVSWDRNNLYLVQDFEDYYFTDVEIKNNDSTFDILYNSSTSKWAPDQVSIIYDPLPSEKSIEELHNLPYNTTYALGSYIGSILPFGFYEENESNIAADRWIIKESSFQATFDISNAYHYGDGVYTLLLIESNQIHAMHSIWYRNNVHE